MSVKISSVLLSVDGALVYARKVRELYFVKRDQVFGYEVNYIDKYLDLADDDKYLEYVESLTNK